MIEIRDLSPDEVNHRFASLSDEQIAEIAPKVLDTCYCRHICNELGIDYCDIRILDMMKIYIHHAYKSGFLKEG
jgi:hypothetical protein